MWRPRCDKKGHHGSRITIGQNPHPSVRQPQPIDSVAATPGPQFACILAVTVPNRPWIVKPLDKSIEIPLIVTASSQSLEPWGRVDTNRNQEIFHLLDG